EWVFLLDIFIVINEMNFPDKVYEEIYDKKSLYIYDSEYKDLDFKGLVKFKELEELCIDEFLIPKAEINEFLNSFKGAKFDPKPILKFVKYNYEETGSLNEYGKNMISKILDMDQSEELFMPEYIDLLYASDSKYIFNHIQKIKQEYASRGKKGSENAIENVTSILKFAERTDFYWSNRDQSIKLNELGKKIVSAILDIDPPEKLFMQNWRCIRIIYAFQPSYIFEYIENVKQKSQVDGKRHDSSMIAKLKPLLEFVEKDHFKNKHYKRGSLDESGKKIVSAILDIDPPEEFFMQNWALMNFAYIARPDYILGRFLERKECKVLESLEERLNGEKIPLVEKIEFFTFGFKINNRHIVGIGFYKNDLETLPESITKLTSLKELNLGHNKLITLPESIGNLTSLKELNLGHNKITTLPESIEKWLDYLKKKGCVIFR
ncbi:MAG: leucine-rich repeat domain-containing protein, partial [Promethearchaeota archaeon]